MSFESKISSFNEFFFFKEFTCSKTTFRPKPTDEVELADNVISLGENLFIYQIKEREEVNDASPQTETKWFESKVLKLATRQIRDTLTYLQTHQEITIENHRGHAFALRLEKTPAIHKLVVYQPNQLLPQECRTQKHHRSKTAGVIHLLSAEDYRGLIWTLLTPAEFADYLKFRDALINRWENDLANFPEQALIGQYLSGSFDRQPSMDFVKYLATIEHNAEDWDVSRMVDLFFDRITAGKDSTQYYVIVREIALLKRGELREFKKRILLSMEKAKTNELVRPYRIASLRTGCGFLFIPLTRDDIPDRQQLLQTLTFVLKYELRLPKCIGVSCAYEADGWYSEEWCYLEFPWEENPLMEEKLRTNNPFREAKYAEMQRYEFREEKL